jgi:hypothetical protein
MHRRGCAPFCSRFKSGAVAIDLQIGTFADRPDDDAKRFAAIAFQARSRVVPGIEQRAAKRQNRRRRSHGDTGSVAFIHTDQLGAD